MENKKRAPTSLSFLDKPKTNAQGHAVRKPAAGWGPSGVLQCHTDDCTPLGYKLSVYPWCKELQALREQVCCLEALVANLEKQRGTTVRLLGACRHRPILSCQERKSQGWRISFWKKREIVPQWGPFLQVMVPYPVALRILFGGRGIQRILALQDSIVRSIEGGL